MRICVLRITDAEVIGAVYSSFAASSAFSLARRTRFSVSRTERPPAIAFSAKTTIKIAQIFDISIDDIVEIHQANHDINVDSWLEENVKDLEFREEIFFDDGYNIIEDINISLIYEDAIKAVEKLDLTYSTTLIMHYVHNKSVNEIAEIMGIPTKTVYTRLTRGKKMLYEALKGAEDGENQ